MKGIFAVKEVVDLGMQGLVLRGIMTEGKVTPGMESRLNGTVIIIREILSTSKGNKRLRSAKKGQRVYLSPMQTVLELLKELEGESIEFDDMRSKPIKEPLVLEPELI